MLRFRSKSSAIGWTGAGADRACVDMRASNKGILKLAEVLAGYQRTYALFGCALARAQQYRYDCDEPDRRPK